MASRPAPALIAIDVDGTLLTDSHRITEATVAALAHVRAHGVEVVLATSRGPRSVKPVLQAAGMITATIFIGSQGAITGRYSADDLEIVAHRPAPLDASLRLVEHALAAGLAVHWFAGEDWLVSHVDQTVEAEAAVVGAEPETADLFAQPTGPDKLMLISGTDDGPILRRLVRDLPPELQAQTSNPQYLEVTRQGVDKGAAVHAHCERLGIDPGNVVAIGDGPNDLGMFAHAGLSIAPANARAAVLAAADHITASNNEDGVAIALRRLVP